MTKNELQEKALDLCQDKIDIHQFMSAIEILSISEDGNIVFRYNPII